MYRLINRLSVVAAALALAACGSPGQTNASQPRPDTAQPEHQASHQVVFDADSAYSYVAKQVSFGPRVPGSSAHSQCADWMIGKLTELQAQNVTEQRAVLQAWDGKTLDVRNISAQYRPEARKRILLLSHWDSRPWADHDPDPAKRSLPIDGANDGASGVGVIMEIARCLAQSQPSIGVDILLVDAEDYGTRADVPDDDSSWCLGTQYWTANPTLDLRQISYAVLLDMVGGKDAVFPREYFSQRYAPGINDKVWRAAKEAGYASRFVNSNGTPVIDDHVHLIKAGVPAIDIIETDHPKTGSFNPTWHTVADNMDNIDPETLRAVGQTLIDLIYSE